MVTVTIENAAKKKKRFRKWPLLLITEPDAHIEGDCENSTVLV